VARRPDLYELASLSFHDSLRSSVARKLRRLSRPHGLLNKAQEYSARGLECDLAPVGLVELPELEDGVQRPDPRTHATTTQNHFAVLFLASTAKLKARANRGPPRPPRPSHTRARPPRLPDPDDPAARASRPASSTPTASHAAHGMLGQYAEAIVAHFAHWARADLRASSDAPPSHPGGRMAARTGRKRGRSVYYAGAVANHRNTGAEAHFVRALAIAHRRLVAGRAAR
jgi:hypothetical protein